LGRRAKGLEPEQALAHVAGVTLACDITARDLQQRDRTFARAKSFDTFCPIGPTLVTDPEWDELELVTRVNGQERQHGRASDLIWSFAELVSYVSRHMTLEPGDLVLTGTPAGVGPLAAGDQVEISSPQIGSLRFDVVSASSA
jgi:2-keto-4-pentenoate hydratase/2-oxohepta-3-ene-1,7-dioic acid hydratase in catechol pathway